MNEVAKKVRAKCMTSRRIDDHKVSFTLGNELIVVCPAHFSCHAGNVTTAFDAPRSKIDGSACRERRFVTKIAPAGDGPMASQVEPIGHHVIEGAEDNAAMSDALVAAVMSLRCERRHAVFSLEHKGQLQSDGVVGATYKTLIGIVS